VQDGELILNPNVKVEGESNCQRRRKTEAIGAAVIYLGGTTSKRIGRSLGVTRVRADQIIQLGIQVLLELGGLYREGSPSPGRLPTSQSPPRTPGRSRG